ncbi:MAG TPA: hypothetical protein VNL92_01835, partial [Dehalococcoidia bacterium]|nr:hypothetical protein [Dehalococcoidia bacterium]
MPIRDLTASEVEWRSGPLAAAVVSDEPAFAFLAPTAADPAPPRVSERIAEHAGWLARRGLDLIPFAIASVLITSMLWGTLFLPVPLAIGLLAFHAYWLYRSLKIGLFGVIGYFRLRKHRRIDWRAKYDEARGKARAGADILAWEDIRHLIIIPTYLESIEKLRPTLDGLAGQVEPDKLFIVLAMEERDLEAPEKAAILCEEYRDRFGGIFATLHPAGIPGEVTGKSSNESWASVQAKRILIDQRGMSLDHFTVTSCDADCIFPPTYYACLTYKFATDPKRYRRFWQSPIFLYNNIWDVPAPLRVPSALGGLNHLSRLCQPFAVIFPQSCYSLSYRLAVEVGHWDVDVVPEDWHMFLKCFFLTNGEVSVDRL